MNLSSFIIILSVCVVYFLFFTPPYHAHANIDLKSESYVLQYLFAFLAGGLVMIKNNFPDINNFFKRTFSKSQEEKSKDE